MTTCDLCKNEITYKPHDAYVVYRGLTFRIDVPIVQAVEERLQQPHINDLCMDCRWKITQTYIASVVNK